MSYEMLSNLSKTSKSCLIYQGDTLIFESDSIGVKPLLLFMERLDTLPSKDNLILFDKVIGKAALLLIKIIGIKEVYTPLASIPALEAARIHDIKLHALSTVPFIINRTGTGMCPLEEAVLHTSDPLVGQERIRDTIALLMKK